MGPDEDLSTLIERDDHLQVLRYIRSQEIREPELVVKHGTALLGDSLKKPAGADEASWLTILEQMCLAALDISDHDTAEKCLQKLKNQSDIILPTSTRFRRLLARCLEASDDLEGAQKIYDSILQENPGAIIPLQRSYCIARAQNREPEVVVELLNKYLGQNMSDVGAWYEMSQLRMSLADFGGAAYALEQVVLGCPLESDVHMKLAEVYATIGGIENLSLARKHMAQALELDATNVRAQFGLISVANQYLEEASTASKKEFDQHEQLVAKELVKYGAGQVLKSYKGKKMFATVKKLMDDFTENLDG